MLLPWKYKINLYLHAIIIYYQITTVYELYLYSSMVYKLDYRKIDTSESIWLLPGIGLGVYSAQLLLQW